MKSSFLTERGRRAGDSLEWNVVIFVDGAILLNGAVAGHALALVSRALEFALCPAQEDLDPPFDFVEFVVERAHEGDTALEGADGLLQGKAAGIDLSNNGFEVGEFVLELPRAGGLVLDYGSPERFFRKVRRFMLFVRHGPCSGLSRRGQGAEASAVEPYSQFVTNFDTMCVDDRLAVIGLEHYRIAAFKHA